MDGMEIVAIIMCVAATIGWSQYFTNRRKLQDLEAHIAELQEDTRLLKDYGEAFLMEEDVVVRLIVLAKRVAQASGEVIALQQAASKSEKRIADATLIYRDRSRRFFYALHLARRFSGMKKNYGDIKSWKQCVAITGITHYATSSGIVIDLTVTPTEQNEWEESQKLRELHLIYGIK